MFYIYASYSAIYGEKIPSVRELLSQTDISPTLFLKVALHINAQLSNKDDTKKVDSFLFDLFFHRIPDYDKYLLSKFKKKVEREGSTTILFNPLGIVELIHQLLLCYNGLPIVRDTKPNDELILYKIILIANDTRTIHDDEKIERGFAEARREPDFFFQRMNWGFILKNSEVQHNLNLFYESFKTMSILNYFEESKDYKEYVDNYKLIKDIQISWEFVFNFLRLYTDLHVKDEKELGHIQYSFSVDDSLTAFFDNLCLDIIDYQTNIEKQKRYIGIKEKPLIKKGNTYYILSWRLLSNQIYTGFIFDFYNNSSINCKHLNFGDFKSFIGQNISESAFFVPIIKSIFQDRKGFYTIHNSDINKNLPDFYVRNGKYIFLFEYKDSLMPDKIHNSYDFKEIQEHIDNTFVQSSRGRKKAVLQLADYINGIKENRYKKYDDYLLKGIKERNLVIYPIIIYTDYRYELSGLNDYLNQKFKNNINMEDNRIKDLTIINLEFIVTNFTRLRNKELDLKRLIDNYHKKIKSDAKSFEKRKGEDRFLNLYRSFELFYYKYYPNKPDKRSLTSLFDCLGFTKKTSKL
ncbi:hypothetical protein [Dysgonomonas sp. 25]|uniref:hypothetical protein n=1 Tax=Dysgonomonas sp. 25 TaxID=2302933 RepID=UPI0013D83999|nr:hypothetical protein [Dysgonomonas sp. 25]NDV69685.1 hypothetical protein [Dysgonomonas sp. 25]